MASKPPTASPTAALLNRRPFSPDRAQGWAIAMLLAIAALEWKLFRRVSLLWGLAFGSPVEDKMTGHGGGDWGRFL